jgi:hypothetical protein
MDSNSRPIVLSLVAVLGFTILAVVASLLIPFRVNETAVIQQVTGEAELHIPGQIPARLDTDNGTTLGIGQSLNVLPGGEATIVFKLNQGRAVLSGPAGLTLVESYRRATALGHALGQSKREYVLTLEQTQGSVRYIFANTDPSFEEIDLTIRLPDGDYSPTTPCWRIDVTAGGETTAEPVECVPSN